MRMPRVFSRNDPPSRYDDHQQLEQLRHFLDLITRLPQASFYRNPLLVRLVYHTPARASYKTPEQLDHVTLE
jgi:hypothetical protein